MILGLPPHCKIKKRNGYADVYFLVDARYRPKDWEATIHLGRTDRTPAEKIIEKAKRVYEEYSRVTEAQMLGFDPSIKEGGFQDIIKKYKASLYWTELAPRTKRDYEYFLADIRDWSVRAGDPHIKHLTPKSIVKWLNKWDETPRRQKYAKALMTILYSSAIREGFIDRNIAKEITLRKRKSQKEPIIIWEYEDVENFIKHADASGFPSVGTAVLIAFETGQRPGDVLSSQRGKNYSNGRFLFKQSKTGKEVALHASEALRRRIDKGTGIMLLLNEYSGKPWTDTAFSKRFREIADGCGLEKHKFKQIRHSVVLHLERAGSNSSGIASVTGHSRKTVQDMIENHYGVDRDEKMAQEAVANLHAYRKKVGHRSGQSSGQVGRTKRGNPQ